MDTKQSLVGKTLRPKMGGKPMVVVREDEQFVYLKRADSSKRSLANTAGGYITERSELSDWTDES